MTRPLPKIAIISHVLPPERSGQAVVLYRLLETAPPECYCLISNEAPVNSLSSSGVATEKLPVRYYYLKSAFSLEFLKKTGHNSVRKNSIFILNALFGVNGKVKQIEQILAREQCKALVACTGDLYNVYAAYLASKKNDVPLILYMFDDFIYQWTGWKRARAKRMEPAIIKHASGIIVTNEYMAREIKHRYGVDSTIVRNPTILMPCPNGQSDDFGFKSNEINIVYTGAIYEAQHAALLNLLEAIKILEKHDFKLHIFTSFSKISLEKNGILGKSVVFHHHVHQTKIPLVLKKADFLFLPLSFNTRFPEVIRTSAPGKLGDYLAAGRPIIVHAPSETFLSEYFQENKCGMVVDKDDATSLADALNVLISDQKMRDVFSKKAFEMANRDFRVELARERFFSSIAMNTLSKRKSR